jgi:hypothetical protein
MSLLNKKLLNNKNPIKFKMFERFNKKKNDFKQFFSNILNAFKR